MVTPLLLAVTPMRVLQDPSLGNEYGKLFEDGEVDDRLLIILFLLVERARGASSFWAPYLDMLPTSFGTPLWFREEELQDLKGTALYNATKIQLKNLNALFEEKVKPLGERFLSSIGHLRRVIEFKDFLWANCIFWTRALNIPCPHSFVFPPQLPTSLELSSFPQTIEHVNSVAVNEHNSSLDIAVEKVPRDIQLSQLEQANLMLLDENKESGSSWNRKWARHQVCEDDPEKYDDSPKHLNTRNRVAGVEQEATVWVEGLVPGIDFCNHDLQGAARWEVDGREGSVTGVPYSMYLVTSDTVCGDTEIRISYGNKGNEELLFLYGFVVESNSDDYLMVHFPKEALNQGTCGEAKSHLIQEQKLSLRWLLPNSLLQNGFLNEGANPCSGCSKFHSHGGGAAPGYSWSGHRKPPSYLHRCVFPEEVIAALRTIAMKDEEVGNVTALLQELSESGLHMPPSEEDIQAAVWEVCGNARAFQLLTDLLASRVLELEEGTGPEDLDTELLDRDFQARSSLYTDSNGGGEQERLFCPNFLSQNRRACIIYRRGQKRLAHFFLQEAEYLLDLCLAEERMAS